MATKNWREGRPSAAQARVRGLFNELEKLTGQVELSKRDEARKSAILAEISAMKSGALAPSREAEVWYRCLTAKAYDEMQHRELRTAMAGTQAITATEGGAGGYLVPQEFHDALILGMAQYDPLLDENVVTLIESTSYQARPITVPGWDLSTISASRVTEGSHQSAGSTPAVAGPQLNGYPYRISMDATFEFEQDSFETGINLFSLAFGFGFARGIGADLVNGSGTNQPQGVLTGAADSGVTLDPTITSDVSATLNDAFQKAYFAVNRAYRAMPKCGWVMSDETYQWIRSLTDKQGRPLLEIRKDKEMLMGKPVFVSPSMPSYDGSPVVTGKIVFGDLSHYVVRVSQAQIGRSIQTTASGADFGKELFVGRMRADSKVIDPTSGVTPPLVYINIHP